MPNDERPTWELVIEDMKARDAVGRARYGTPLQPHNGRDSLVDAYEEKLDDVVYMKNAIIEQKKLKADLARLENENDKLRETNALLEAELFQLRSK